MMETEEFQYLSFNVKLLKFFRMWTYDDVDEQENDFAKKSKLNKWLDVRSYYIILVLLPSAVALMYDFVRLTGEEDSFLRSITILMEITNLYGAYYMILCFVHNRDRIRRLVDELHRFREFCDCSALAEIDDRANRYAMYYIAAATAGAGIYISVPFFTLDQCERMKEISSRRHLDTTPCGAILRYRLPFRFDYTPTYEIVVAHQIFLVFVVTYVVVTMTMLLFGILYHTTGQLNLLREMIDRVAYDEVKAGGAKVKTFLGKIVRYHQAIIDYVDGINAAFGSQMILHITLTSLVISAIGFVIISSKNATDAIRYGVHLSGWCGLLFITCVYGQKLMDESTAIGTEMYGTSWYHLGSLPYRKDIVLIILRSQKPLTLNALSLGTISLAVFLKIMSSAYSYFTLMINFMD